MLYSNAYINCSAIICHRQTLFPRERRNSPSTTLQLKSVTLCPWSPARLEDTSNSDLNDFLWSPSSRSRSEQLLHDELSSLNFGTVSIGSFDAKAVLYFFCFVAELVLCYTNDPVSIIVEFKDSTLSKNSLTASSEYKKSAMHDSNVFPMTPLRSRSSMTYSKTLYKNDQMPLFGIRNTVLGISSIDCLTIVDNSFLTITITRDSTCAIMYSSCAQQFSVRKFLSSTVTSL